MPESPYLEPLPRRAPPITLHTGFGEFMQNLQSALGVVAIIAFAWAISENRRMVSPRRIAVGLVVAFVLARE